MAHCTQCGKKADGGDKYCGGCGHVLSMVEVERVAVEAEVPPPLTHCLNCRTKVEKHDKFCFICGKDLKQASVALATSHRTQKWPKHHPLAVSLIVIGAVLLLIGMTSLANLDSVRSRAANQAYRELANRHDVETTEMLRRFGIRGEREIAQMKEKINELWLATGGYDGNRVAVANAVGERARKRAQGRGTAFLVLGALSLIPGILIIQKNRHRPNY